jgi:4-amino-4-deoxy-L-arabinose transferase-like glycosyltransferase
MALLSPLIFSPWPHFTLRRVLPAAVLLAAAGILYFWRLNEAPMLIGGDEAYFALHARSIASTARDVDGRFLPLFFKIDLATWYQPMLVYLMAPVLKVFGVSEWTVRTPMAAIAVVNVLLTYAVANRLFVSVRYAVFAALLMATTPVHVIVGRMAVDYLGPVPFVLGWLWCLLVAIDTGSVRWAFGACLLLAAGFFSYVAAWFMMPVYFVMTLAPLWWAPRRTQQMLAATAGFLALLLPFAVWLRGHSDVLGTILARYHFGDSHHEWLQSVRYLLHYYVIQERLSLYWRYFDPVYLFMGGSPDPVLGTRKAGVFLAAICVLLAVGLYDIVRRRDRSLLLLAGIVTAPLAPVLVNTGNAIQRQLVLIPFVVLTSVYGARRLLQHPAKAVRVGTVLLLMSLPVQFAYFAHDYFTDYRIRAAARIDPVNFREVARSVFADDSSKSIPRFYLSEALDDGVARWRFYLAKYGRDDVLMRTWILDPPARNMWSVLEPVPTVPVHDDTIPPGSLFLLNANDPGMAQLVGEGRCCELVREVRAPSGAPASLLIRKTR